MAAEYYNRQKAFIESQIRTLEQPLEASIDWHDGYESPDEGSLSPALIYNVLSRREYMHRDHVIAISHESTHPTRNDIVSSFHINPYEGYVSSFKRSNMNTTRTQMWSLLRIPHRHYLLHGLINRHQKNI